jgi:GntR family transcriptional regulator, arabinose operon transcriptional repressor
MVFVQKEKQQNIAEKLMEEIRAGIWKNNEKLPPESEIGKRFGVNKLTANKALGILVGKDYCRRSRGRGGTVVTWQEGQCKGLIGCFQGNSNSYFHTIVRGIQSVFYRRNYLMAYFTNIPNSESLSIEQQLARYDLKGFLSIQTVLGELPFPFLVVSGNVERYQSLNFVTCDNEGSGRLQALHLLDMGHKEIVYVSHNAGINEGPRTLGFRKALEEAGIEQLDERFYMNSFESLRSPMVLDRILARWPNVTAIGFDNDPAAANTIWMLLSRGIKVPEEISVIGMGPVHEEYNHPLQLTTIDAHPYQMGERAAELMIDKIEGFNTASIAEILPTQLFIGETVARTGGKASK